MKTVLAWHFCRNDRKLGYSDGRLVKTGQTYKVGGKPILCQHGLHASIRLIDALNYAAGDVLCRVKLSGNIVHGKDKIAATERTVLSTRNISIILHEFACRCAERSLKKAEVTDSRCWAAISAKRQWLRGEISDNQLAAARAAARAAAVDAARDVARAAAVDAARDVARAAARAKQNKRLTRMVKEVLRKGDKT